MWQAMGQGGMSVGPTGLFGRFRELTLLALAAVCGSMAGAVVAAIGWLTSELHALLFGIGMEERLSEQRALAHPWLFVVPAIGGVIIGASLVLARRISARVPVDPIEANALHGGRMSIRDSLIVAAQTTVSSGFGASVGLEAGYTQVAASLASRLGGALSLKRNDVRMLVGCGAAGAISAAFDTPIAGAFYAFELIVGTYSVALVAPILIASLAARFTAGWLGVIHVPIAIGPVAPVTASDLAAFTLLGVLCGLAAVVTMRLVAAIEAGFRRSGCPLFWRPVIGGLIVGGFGYVSPQVLSSGHGALHLELALSLGWQALLFLFGLKLVSAALSLASGFRGGLFFSSLFLGSLLGKLFVVAVPALWPQLPPMVAAVVGMAAMAVGAVGGPLTMTFLALESTGDLALSVPVVLACVASAVVVRETFGYSFSTWRLHLRGETIRSAHDVGRIRNLTVASMMRRDVRTVDVDQTPAGFRAQFPLGSGQRVVALTPEGRYAGIVIVANAHGAPDPAVGETEPTLRPWLVNTDAMLLPSMSAEAAATVFRSANSEELAVVDTRDSRRVIGLLTEQHLLRRYAEELDLARLDLAGGS